IALGSQEVSLMELVQVYSVFANRGRRVEPHLIQSVTDSRGETLYARPQYDAPRVYPAELARDITAMLSRVVYEGTGARAKVSNWQVAGKTGTSQDWRDAWFVGYSSSLVGGIWVGNDNDSPMDEVAGGGLPAQIWSTMMIIAHEDLDPSPLEGAQQVKVSAAAQERIDYYRKLSSAFRTLEAEAPDPPSQR
ncbi:MAG: penicillin-binding transpeptidase domain-containing protein, partial [Pseudomonadota bacterium]